MANTKSAAKNARKSVRNRDRNRDVKDQIKKLEKEYRKLAASNPDEAKIMLPKVASAFDKAAKSKTIHPNKARRKSARLSKLLAASAAPASAAA